MSEFESSDLICRARSGRLSEQELRQLEHSLRASGDARLLHRLLQHLDRESRVQRSDEERIARIVTVGSSAFRRSAGHRAPMARAVAVGIAAILVGGAASAWWLARTTTGTPFGSTASAIAPLASQLPINGPGAPSRWTVTAPSLSPAESAEPPIPRISLAGSHQPGPTGSPTDSNQPEAAGSPTDSNRPGPADTSADSRGLRPAVSTGGAGSLAPAAHPSPETPGASTLFSQANLRRREGNTGEARSLYRAILSRYPRTREASLAQLILAKLDEDLAPERALAQYRRLAASDARLRAEALWGMAQTAQRTGQTTIEQQALTQLVREFPDSPYAEVARSRLPHAPR
jgi:hypothetical protein